MSGRAWTPREIALLRRLYPQHSAAEIACRLQRPVYSVYNKAGWLGLRKSREWIAETARRRMLDPDHPGRLAGFKPGHRPWNTGKKGWRAGGRSADTRFQPGSVSPRWDPQIYCVGALRINHDGALEIKVRAGSRSWVSLARWTWETERGPIPRGMVVRASNGDPHDTRIGNLRLATRADIMRQNSLHNYPEPLARAIQLRGALIRKLNRRDQHEPAHDR